ncbi:TRAM/LAG1/CLN8 domain [Trinorchestia longiramus]|nr:TRAM/LAG1/CLN8 domain [Trinorchestia longiramus]
MEWGRGFESWLWSPSFWLPEGYNWADIQSTDEKQYPEFRNLFTYPIIFAALILAVRFYVLNPFIFKPFAIKAGLRYKKYLPPPRNDLLEKLFCESRVSSKDISNAAESLGWTRRDVERWIRQRNNSGKLTKLDKFQESAFLASYHIIISMYGLYIMYDEPWLWEISAAWLGYPLHELKNGQWWYYMISISFYFALCVSHLRCGFTSYVHHVCTILLLAFSWTCNLIRLGSLVLLVHECGDILLQAGKMTQYLEKQKATAVLLGVFLIVWISTRVILFPFWIFKNAYFEAPKVVFMPAAYVLYGLLLGVLALNVFWTFVILLIIVRSLFKGAAVEDIRSAESSDENDKTSKAQ